MLKKFAVAPSRTMDSIRSRIKYTVGMGTPRFKEIDMGRVEVSLDGVYLGILLPAPQFFPGVKGDFEFLSADSETQLRGDSGQIAYLLSEIQRKGSLKEAVNSWYEAEDMRESLGF